MKKKTKKKTKSITTTPKQAPKSEPKTEPICFRITRSTLQKLHCLCEANTQFNPSEKKEAPMTKISVLEGMIERAYKELKPRQRTVHA